MFELITRLRWPYLILVAGLLAVGAATAISAVAYFAVLPLSGFFALVGLAVAYVLGSIMCVVVGAVS